MSNLLTLLYVMFSCVFVTFPCGVLGQVWYLIVSIPDLCLLPYFIIKAADVYFKAVILLFLVNCLFMFPWCVGFLCLGQVLWYSFCVVFEFAIISLKKREPVASSYSIILA